MKIEKHQLDPELQRYYRPTMSIAWLISREWGIKLMRKAERFSRGKEIKGLVNDERYIPSTHGGPDIRVRIYKPENASADQPLPILLYIHGGGYVLGCPELFGMLIERFIKARPCIVVAPDYRKAHDAPFPAGFDDCYDTLLWARDHAAELGARSDKFMIGGHSAGGGMTAALTWKARDTKDVDVAFQMPIYPMIDDRHQTESGQHMLAPLWGTPNNKLAWSLYLKGRQATDGSVPDYAAPARNQDYTDFPPTITFVGDLEPFRDETIAYADALKGAGVPVKFELFTGCFHGFDGMKSAISTRALDFTFDSFAEYYDTYL
ncbi:alpha/beta hydrolase [Litorivivens sp.]|uniref:alpha/beta hydrolase n=2 Tax=Litorivivens sp. TaxID=2020868 RepID=UPI003566C426